MTRFRHTKIGRMIRAARREFSRGYDGAGSGRRWRDAPPAFPSNAHALAGASAIRARTRHLCANNPYAAKALSTLVSAIVGAGIKPQATLAEAESRTAFNLAFERWTDIADAEAVGDFYALTASMVSAMVRDGEALALMETQQDDGRFGLRQIPAEQLDASMTRELGGGARIIAGVEFDASGRRVAYHIFPDNPDMPFALSSTPLRVDASDVVHLFERQFAGQVRGVSWFAPVLLRIAEHDKAEDAQLVRQQIGAMLAGFISDQEGNAGGFEGTRTGTGLEGGLEPGTLKVLKPGQEIKFSDPPTIGSDSIEFMRIQLRGVAAGLGVTYEQLTGDYSSTNYSSARASLIEFRRRIETVQHHTVVFQFCRPVFRRWATLEIFSGRIDAPGFDADPEPYLTPRWITPGWQWVDPSKEIGAQRDAVEAGFMSRREVVAGRGLDIEQLDEERAVDAARSIASTTPVSPTLPSETNDDVAESDAA